MLMCPLGGLSHQILRDGLPSLEAGQGCIDVPFLGWSLSSTVLKPSLRALSDTSCSYQKWLIVLYMHCTEFDLLIFETGSGCAAQTDLNLGSSCLTQPSEHLGLQVMCYYHGRAYVIFINCYGLYK